MKKNIILYFFISLLFLSSCVKYIDLPQTDEEQKNVINGVLVADSTAKIVITKTSPIEVNTEVKYIDTANVKIYGNDIFLEQLQCTEAGTYLSDLSIKRDSVYSVKVSIGREIYEVKNIQVPEKPAEKLVFQDVQLIGDSSYVDNPYLYKYRFKLTINDGAGEDYYGFAAYTFIPQPKYDTVGNITGVQISKYSFDFSTESKHYFLVFNFPGYFLKALTMNDLFFNGENYEDIFTTDVISFDTTNHQIPSSLIPDSVKVFVQYIKFDESCYKFFSSLEHYYQVKDNPFIEPVNIYSNVQGDAIGVIGAMTMTADTITVPVFKYGNSDIE